MSIKSTLQSIIEYAYWRNFKKCVCSLIDRPYMSVELRMIRNDEEPEQIGLEVDAVYNRQAIGEIEDIYKREGERDLIEKLTKRDKLAAYIVDTIMPMSPILELRQRMAAGPDPELDPDDPVAPMGAPDSIPALGTVPNKQTVDLANFTNHPGLRTG